MFVVVPIMNSEPFIKVGHRISESSRKFSIRYPNFLIFQRAVNSIMNYYMNSTVVLRIQLHIVMYLGYTRIRFYQNWPRDYGLLSPPILFIRRFDFLLLLLQLLGWGILFLYKKLQKYIKEKYFS